MAQTNNPFDNPYVDPDRSRRSAQRRRSASGRNESVRGYGYAAPERSGPQFQEKRERERGFQTRRREVAGGPYGARAAEDRGAASYGRTAGRDRDRRAAASRRERGFGEAPGRSAFSPRPSVRGEVIGAGRRGRAGFETPSRRGAAEQARASQRLVKSPHGRSFQMPQLASVAARGGGRRLNSNVVTSVVGIVVVAVIVITGIVMWSTRSVDLTLNGKQASVRVGSTVEQIIAKQGLTPATGNLISVSGNKLEDGGGYPYLVKVSGDELDGTATAAYRAKAGDDLSIEDGRDRTEDYDVQTVTEQPKLEMGGDAWGNISYVSQWPKAGSYEMRTGKASGETARGDTLQETQNAVVSIHQIKPSDSSKKLVALTFDDGPAEKYTEAYLDILNKYGIHATFFNLGQNIEEYPDLSKKIVEQGSEVMSHTYQHQQLSKLDAQALQQEFSSTFAAIKDKVGVDTTSFRPPYGDFTEKAWLNSGGEASVSVLWNQDSLDWKRPGASAIVTNALKGITSGSIILMHDGGGPRDQDVQALPQIIETLQGQGYEFVTVSELMQSDDSIPDDIASGNATMPEGATWPTELVETKAEGK